MLWNSTLHFCIIRICVIVKLFLFLKITIKIYKYIVNMLSCKSGSTEKLHLQRTYTKIFAQGRFLKSVILCRICFCAHDLGAANGKATVRKPRFSFSVAFQPVFRSLFVLTFSYSFAVTVLV